MSTDSKTYLVSNKLIREHRLYKGSTLEYVFNHSNGITLYDIEQVINKLETCDYYDDLTLNEVTYLAALKATLKESKPEVGDL